MKDLLIKHQLEECHPIREYKAQMILKAMTATATMSEPKAKLEALRQANQRTNAVIEKVVDQVKKDRTVFCREQCGLYQLREQKVNRILSELISESK
ncbi:hypothetical protein BVJ53_00495 [Lacticaseibacillus chiayiensis]|uniref:Uncharacterized protein n=1 Tax=Lacticaseibacillus chiayiensis TaxID=2100821 RepID=A0A4Q1UFC5_9LACO|nr:hypothetical protein [Lacticaseibacillus chiayiensis]QVI34579.1 hypothetical protein KG086_12545 [Lacticaseibacillus chiayiensis]RXT30729.1 hypothetical protein BVJ53_00495 [Lacticaseibacillus chiayiensis]RXT59032.1 hypothetical protein CHT97_02975 [Lacticaseibacillus chiayiensis]UYN56313.1 hypothetical protein OFW50_12735 [Lacticaseibacillus chiayiensis]